MFNCSFKYHFLQFYLAELLPIQNPPHLLHISKPNSHPNYIYPHFPEFPDPYTYIKTEVTRFHSIDLNRTFRISTKAFLFKDWNKQREGLPENERDHIKSKTQHGTVLGSIQNKKQSVKSAFDFQRRPGARSDVFTYCQWPQAVFIFECVRPTQYGDMFVELK